MTIHNDPKSGSAAHGPDHQGPVSEGIVPGQLVDPLAQFNNYDSASPIQLGPSDSYSIGEHLLWAPRRVRVGCIGAGASGIMLCYKKEKEFGNDIDLVIYEREFI